MGAVAVMVAPRVLADGDKKKAAPIHQWCSLLFG